MAKTKRKKPDSSATGQELIAGLKELTAAMSAGSMAEVEQRFTVHRVPVSAFHRPEFSPADIAAIRDNIGASQAVFAALLGTSANTVRAWEQGINPPSGIAARFLDEIRRTPDYWRNRIAEAAG